MNLGADTGVTLGFLSKLLRITIDSKKIFVILLTGYRKMQWIYMRNVIREFDY